MTDCLNCPKLTFVQRLHLRGRKHHRHMNEAKRLIEIGYATAKAAPETGWSYIDQAIKQVVACHCNAELWPPEVRKALGVTSIVRD